jgi:hypothetical protein
MKPKELPTEDQKAHARRLVAEYTLHGLGALGSMSQSDRKLLLAEKQTHLAQVEERCSLGQGLHVNVPLRRILQRDVKDIGRSVKGKQRDIEMER